MATTREIAYDADGLTMVGHLARPVGDGACPAVLIAHDGIGLNDFQRHFAEDLADRGYVALAMEYHGGRWFSDHEALLARVLPLIADPDRMRAIGRAALDVLLAEPGVDSGRIAGVGFGAGGSIELELARGGVPFQALALIHPGLPVAAPEDWSGVTGTYLLATGSQDPLCTPAQVLAFTPALQEAGVDWRVNVYGGAKHAFWHPPVRPDGTLSDADEHDQSGLDHAAYHPQHARRAWRDVLDLLAERLPVTA